MKTEFLNFLVNCQVNVNASAPTLKATYLKTLSNENFVFTSVTKAYSNLSNI